MRRYMLGSLLAPILIGATAPAPAQADSMTVCEKAFGVRAIVVKKHGKRAPGRNICRFGMQSRYNPKWTAPATSTQKVTYLHKLRVLAHSSPYLVAGPPRQPPAGTATPVAGAILQRIAECESGGNPATDTGNGFYGKYQFTMSTWQAMGGSGNPAQASEAEQDRRAAALYAQAGAGQWPVCGR